MTGLPEVATRNIRTCGKTASQHSRTPSRAIGRSTPDPSRKRPPGRPRTKWTDQFRRDDNNVPIATLVAVTRERRYGPSRLRVNDNDVWGVSA